MTIVGYTGFLTLRDGERSAFARLAQHARDGEVTVALEQVPLDHIAEAWARLQAGASRKLVVSRRRAAMGERFAAARPSRAARVVPPARERGREAI